VRVISIINQKGGCGKTTTAINLSGVLARRGLRCLLVDMDPQSHCAAGLAIPESRVDLDSGDLLLAGDDAEFDAGKLLWRAARNLDLVPSRMKLAGLEASRGGLADKPDRERRLALALERFRRNYDVCVVDCSPSIGLLTFNALTAADDILIPVETGYFALEGATKQVNTVRMIGRRLGRTPAYWLLPTIHDEDSPLARDILDELRRRFGKRVIPRVIRRDATLKEAASFGQPIVEFAPAAQGTTDYASLADWMLGALSLTPASRPRVPEPIGVWTDSAPEPSDGGSQDDGPTLEVVTTPLTRAGMVRQGTCVPGSPLSERAAGGGVAGESPRTTTDPSPAECRGGCLAPSPEPVDTDVPVSRWATRAEELAARVQALVALNAKHAPAGGDESDATPRAVTMPVPPPPSVERLYGTRETGSGVLFVQPLTLGQDARVVGDFNDWSPTAHPMRRNEALGVFEVCIPLPPGRREYRLIVDGRWILDPHNGERSTNEFGDANSVVFVGAGARPELAVHVRAGVPAASGAD